MAYLPFLGAVLLVLPTLSLTCSQPIGRRAKTLNQRVALADIVVHARALNKTESPGLDYYWPEAYDGTMEVYCVLKGGPLPENITVVEMGYIGGLCTANEGLNSCGGTGSQNSEKKSENWPGESAHA